MELYKITGEAVYLNDALKTANNALTGDFTQGNIMKDEGGGDGGLFKGILVRNLMLLITDGNISATDKTKFAELPEAERGNIVAARHLPAFHSLRQQMDKHCDDHRPEHATERRHADRSGCAAERTGADRVNKWNSLFEKAAPTELVRLFYRFTIPGQPVYQNRTITKII